MFGGAISIFATALHVLEKHISTTKLTQQPFENAVQKNKTGERIENRQKTKNIYLPDLAELFEKNLGGPGLGNPGDIQVPVLLRDDVRVPMRTTSMGVGGVLRSRPLAYVLKFSMTCAGIHEYARSLQNALGMHPR